MKKKSPKYLNETYMQMDKRHEKEVHAFLDNHCFFSFGKEQFAAGVSRWKAAGKLDSRPLKEQLYQIDGGGYMLKSDREAWRDLCERVTAEKFAAIDADKAGTGFCYQMFDYELPNYEFSYTGDIEETLNALALDSVDFYKFPQLYKALTRAAGEIIPGYIIPPQLDREAVNAGKYPPVFRRGLFELGALNMTPGAAAIVPPADMAVLFARHGSGDWGTLPEDDKEANNAALKNGDRILSAYKTDGGKVWIITEADRSATTILLPDEY